MKKQKKINSSILRLLDANLNRSKEGLRVIEDITRFILNEKKLTQLIKHIRHAITNTIKSNDLYSYNDLICKRNIRQDIGKNSILSELKRNNVYDIFIANSQRIKESIRVLEEFNKLINSKEALKLKKIRYRFYDIEKLAIEKINKLCNNKKTK